MGSTYQRPPLTSEQTLLSREIQYALILKRQSENRDYDDAEVLRIADALALTGRSDMVLDLLSEAEGLERFDH